MWNVLVNEVENFSTSNLHTFCTLSYQRYSQALGSLSNKDRYSNEDRYGNENVFKKGKIALFQTLLHLF